MSMYVRVIIPVRLSWTPVYRTEVPLSPGDRVKVLFAGREYIGAVSETSVEPDVAEDRISSVLEVCTALPPVSAHELALWRFVASYYLCTVGEVYKAAYPSMKLKSEQTAVAAALRRQAAMDKAAAALELKVEHLRQRLDAKEKAIAARSSMPASRRKPSVDARLEAERAGLQSRLDGLVRSACASGCVSEDGDGPDCGMPMISRTYAADTKPGIPCIAEIKSCFGRGGTVFLEGGPRVDAYVRLCIDTVLAGRKALVLVPDLMFCDRLERELRTVFPGLMVYNSLQPPASRRKLSDAVRGDGPAVVLGTRSAVFLPFSGLGLVVVDEEQDVSYKQDEPAPRYNGRDVALQLARMHGANVVLGSSAPSLETLYNSLTGKFSLVRASSADCAAQAGTDAIEIVDVNAERRKNGMVGAFSRCLIRAVAEVPGRIALIRGWEDMETTVAAAEAVFPGRDVSVMTLQEAKRGDVSGASVVAVLQADALVRRDDFRADERAVQVLSLLSGLSYEGGARRIIVQTASPARFSSAVELRTLLAERKAFNCPPYARVVDLSVVTGDETRRRSVSGRLASALKAAVGAVPGPGLPSVAAAGDGRVRVSLPRDAGLSVRKDAIAAVVAAFEKECRHSVRITADVDPQ